MLSVFSINLDNIFDCIFGTIEIALEYRPLYTAPVLGIDNLYLPGTR